MREATSCKTIDRAPAFFDVDRTLLRVHSGSLFIRWRRRIGALSRLDAVRLQGWLLQSYLGVLDAPQVSTRVLSLFCGESERQFAADCRGWFAEELSREISSEARSRVKAYQLQGVRVVLLSAATRYVCEPLADALGITDIICSTLEVEGDRFTGTVRDLCYGKGKVIMAEQWAERTQQALAGSAFYSDSISDLPMLERVDRPHVINPDPRLYLYAKVRGWPIETWRS